jgi:TolB-like protein
MAMSTSSADVPHRKLLAILFADIHGYSQLMGRSEESTFSRVERSIRLYKSLIGDYGGEVVNVAGDGILCIFDSAIRALKFAVEVQREFRNDAVWSPEDEQIAFRIGIDLGEVMFGNATIHGHSVNIAARIQALADPGGICVSEAVRRAVRDEHGARMHSMGQQRLKNIAELVEIFAVEVNGRESPALAGPRPAYTRSIELPAEASVAVLSLDNLSGDPRNEHLCEGITDEIITNLSRFRDLLVIARHSVFLFKNLHVSVQQIASQLGVRYVLTGNLQRTGSKIRINVQLIVAESGTVIWSERYDGDLSDVFVFQDEVTDIIAARLAVQISAAERRRASELQPSDLRAYGLILRGQHLGFQFTKRANWHARRLFEQAKEIDSEYGRSYAAMSRTFNLDWRYAWTSSPEASLNKAVEFALDAIDRDSSDARAHSELGFAYLYNRQHDTSLAAYRRALELNPNDADILVEFADALVYDGQPEKSLEWLKKAMRLNPYYPDWYLWYLADAYNALGRSEDVIATVEKMRNPAEGRRMLAANYAHLGKLEKAEAQAREVLKLHPKFTISSWAQRPPYKDREVLDRYMEGLRKAGLPKE